jgi:hypothetical protein
MRFVKFAPTLVAIAQKKKKNQNKTRRMLMNSLEFTPTLANQDNNKDGHNLGSCHHLNNNNNKIIKNKGVSKKKTLEERKKSLLVEFDNVGSELVWHFVWSSKTKKKGKL